MFIPDMPLDLISC